MSLEQTSALLQETMRVSLWVSAPLLLVALALGLVISILQAATQVNEQTLTFVPKIVGVMLTFAVFFPWIMRHLVEFGTRILAQVAQRGGP